MDLIFPNIFDMLRYTNKKGNPLMISTALAIQDATKNAVHDEGIMDMARVIYHMRNEMTANQFARAIFEYSASLSALTATLVTHACLTENQINDMMETIEEMEAMGKDID